MSPVENPVWGQILADVLQKEIDELHKEGVRIIHIGRLEGLSPDLRNQIINAVELTSQNKRLILNVAWNYGGRDEILHAMQQIMSSTSKVLIDQKSGGNLLYMPLDRIMQMSGVMPSAESAAKPAPAPVEPSTSRSREAFRSRDREVR